MIKPNILYEDNHILVVEKPENVLSQEDKTKDIDMLSLLKDYIKEKYNKPGNVYLGLVHRLDRPVGGVMVFAKTSKAASRLSEQIKKNEIEKTYIAVVKDIGIDDEGEFVDHLEKGPNGISAVSKKGKLSKLSYQVLERVDDKALVRIKLQTGRHHQIRVQFSSRGFYICGDQRYGKEDKTQIALFAYRLVFRHPVTKNMMEFELLPVEKGHWTGLTLSKNVKKKK